MSAGSGGSPIVRRRRQPNWGAIVLGSFVVLFMLFLLAPIAAVVVVSFSSSSFILFPLPGLSLRWYHRILEYRPFIDALIVSIELAFSSAVLGACLGVPAALWAARSVRSKSFFLPSSLLSPNSSAARALRQAASLHLSAGLCRD